MRRRQAATTSNRKREASLVGNLLRLLRHEPWGQSRAFSEEEIVHLLRDDLLRLFLPRHEAVLVEDHLHALFPELPCLDGDLLEDTLSQFTRPWWGVESRKILLKLDAVHRPAALVADGR